MEAAKKVLAMAGVIFILLGVLFGAMIMTFIFGQMGNTDFIDDESFTIANEAGAYINGTGYTLAYSTEPGFANPVIITIWNASNGSQTFALTNATVSSIGVVTNASPLELPSVNLSYSYTAKGNAERTADSIVNESLTGIVSYSNQSNTQFLVTSISITLLILIALFVVFWKYFMKDTIMKTGGNDKAGNFG